MRPTLTLLAPGMPGRIVDEAMDILARTGVVIDDPRALLRLSAAGLTADSTSGRVRFPRGLIEQALRDAPASFTLHARDGTPHATLGGDRVHFVPGSSALRVLDRESQRPRAPRTADLVEYVKLADGLGHIDYLSTAFVPADVPEDLADAWRLYTVLAHSRKPVVSGAFTASGVPRMAELMLRFRASRADLLARPMALFTCCPNTPLRWGEDAIRNLMDCAEWGIPIEIVPVVLLGMIAPATIVGALVLHTAEVLSGLVVAQLVRPGAPLLFGGAPASFHMRLMTSPMTAVEALRVACAYAEIARSLRLPCQAYMALSDAKANDPQAGMETGTGAVLAALAGIHSVSGPGMLDYVNCFSLEKLVFDDEVVAHAQRLIRPVEVRDDLPTHALIEELVREQHLLTAEHTLEHWPRELYLPGPMVDRTNADQWEEQGCRDWRARAGDVIAETLARYEEPPLDPALDAELRDLFRRTAADPGVVLPAF